MRWHTVQSGALLLAAALFAYGAASPAGAFRAPADLASKIGFDQELGAQVPVQVLLQDVHGAAVPLRTLLGGKPAILVPVYYRCKNLCDAVRAGIAQRGCGQRLESGSGFQRAAVEF